MVARAPRRIAIIGNAGTGKSLLAERIGALLGIPPAHLDRLLWTADWQMAGDAEFERLHGELIQRHTWIIDGLGHPSTLGARIEAADAVIVPRYPLWRCYFWALKREIGGGGTGRPDGSARAPLGRLVRAIWRNQRDIMPLVDELVASSPRGQIVRVLRSPRQLPALFGEVEQWAGIRPSARSSPPV